MKSAHTIYKTITFSIKVPGKGLFCLPIVPDTSSQSTQDKQESTEFQAGGLYAYPITPMRSWKISYEGDLR